MERSIKINFPHQTRWDEINDKLWFDFEIVESYKQMLNNAIVNHISRKERDKLSEQLQENLDNFHYDFLYGCQKIIEDITSQYVDQYKTKEMLFRLEQELENSLITFVNNWKSHVSPIMTLRLLLKNLSYEDICKLRYPKYTSFVIDNYSDEVTLNMEIIWKKVFNYLDMSDSEFVKQIDNNVKFYL